jgi:proteic killer suppression protein
MIKSFKHKGLKTFFYDGDRSRINPNHAVKLARILDRLDASMSPQDMIIIK